MAQKKRKHKIDESGSQKAGNGDVSRGVSEETVLRKCIFSFVAGAFFIGCVSVVFDLARYKMKEGEFPAFRAFLVGEPVGCAEKPLDEGKQAEASDSGSVVGTQETGKAGDGDEASAVKASVCAADAQKKQDAAFDKVQAELVDALSICGLTGTIGIVFDVDKAGSVRVSDVTGVSLEKNDVACVSQFVKDQKYPLDAICADSAHVSWELDLTIGNHKGVKKAGAAAEATASKRVASADTKSATEPKTTAGVKTSATKQSSAKTSQETTAQDRASSLNVEKKIVFVASPGQDAAAPNTVSQIVVPKQDTQTTTETANVVQQADPPVAVPTVNREEVISTVKSMMAAKLTLAAIECQADGTLKGTAVLRNDGSLKNIRTASGTLKGTAAETCIVGKLAGIHGSAFSGGQEVIPWMYPAE